MDNNPAKEVSSINFESVIGGPLRAIIRAQAQSALATVEFIKNAGFIKDEKGQITEPIYVSFKYPKELVPYQPRSGGSLVSIEIDSPGNNYTSAPEVIIKNAEGYYGYGARVHAEIEKEDDKETFKIKSIIIDEGGTGYEGEPSVSLEGGGGDGATIKDVKVSPIIPMTKAIIQDMKFEVPLLSMLPIPFIRIEEATVDFNCKINSMQEESVTKNTEATAGLEAGAYAMLGTYGGGLKMKVSATHKRTSTSNAKIERTYTMAVHVRAVQDESPAAMERIIGLLEDLMTAQPVDAPKEKS